MTKKKKQAKIPNYERYAKTHIGFNTFFWFVGLILLFLIWWILSATLNDSKFIFPTIGDTFKGIGKILGADSLKNITVPEPAQFMIGKEWAALGIAVGQTAMCFICAFIVVAICVYLTHLFRPLNYVFAPFVTYTRTLPTAVIMCIISLLFAPGSANVWLIPIIVAFCILFPVLYNGLQSAFGQANKDKLEVGYIYGLGKWQIFTKIILKQMTPYIFSSMVTGFGLTFKVVLASQLVSIAIVKITPNYASVGWMIGIEIDALNAQAANASQISGIILGWGIIAIFISLLFELGFKGIGWLCMPWTHKKFQSPKVKEQANIENKKVPVKQNIKKGGKK